MSLQAADRIAKALLYEGYLLYPYTPSATKNRQRWTFGGLYPPSYVARYPGADASETQTECLLEAEPDAKLTLRLRFLHLIARMSADAAPAEGMAQAGFDVWEEACEREVALVEVPLAELTARALRLEFHYPASERVEGGFRRTQQPIDGRLEMSATQLRPGLFKIHARVENTSAHEAAERSQALLRSLVSTHKILEARGGRFVSAIDPPDEHREAASQCRNIGTWPVLIGTPGERDVMLSSPIILYDHPQVAPESPGDLFDCAEIDEILTLRILTLSEEEKAQIRATDERARALLDRTEGLTEEDLLRLHGRLRELPSHGFRPGDRVRIRTKGARKQNPSDVFDLALDGLTARIESIEQLIEGDTYLSVTLDADPGRDLGVMGQPGHRFFFRLDEVEPA